MKNNLKLYLAVVAVSFFCFGPTFGAIVFAADQNPCSEDIAKFCKDIEPGMTALMNCLEKHEKELSGGCQLFEAKMLGVRVEKEEKVREKTKFRQACMSDMNKFCNDADPVKGGMLTCLKEHENDLSTTCIESMRAL